MKNNAYIEKKLGKEIEQVSREELIALVNKMKNEKKYGLVWENQVEEMEKLLEMHYPMLQEDSAKAIVKDPSKPTNLIIEGDNLHSLNTLLYTHREKIDVIYIDPPYNTGNKDFVYNDRYVDKEHSWRHSAWLSFMEKRLRLAKELLSDVGVIFISIDDNEQAQLKLLSDDVFGEQNFISNMVWKCRTSMQYSSPTVSTQTESVLVYSKNKNSWNMKSNSLFTKIKKDEDIQNYKNPDNDSKGAWITSGIIRNDGRKKYTVTTPSGKSYHEAWLYSEENMIKFREEGRLWFGVNNDSKPRKKSYWSDYEGKVTSNLLMDEFEIISKESGSKVKKKVFEIGTTEQGTNQLKEILGDSSFNYPKPTSLIKYLARLHPNRNATVLDFFAGSGTTGHAVLELNAEDGGNRQFILCTHGKESEASEVNIAEDITYERIKRVINGYTTPKGKEINGIDGNVKYYKTVLVEKDQDVNDLKAEMAQHAKDLLCIKDNAFEEVASSEESFLFESNDVLMGIHLGEHYDVPDALRIPLTKTDKLKVLYLKVDDVPADEDEINVLLKANIDVKPIPKKIMDLFDENARQ